MSKAIVAKALVAASGFITLIAMVGAGVKWC